MSTHRDRAMVQLSRRALLAFYGLAFALAWACWLVPLLAQEGVIHLAQPPALFFLAGAFAPTLAALLVTARMQGGAGVRRLLGQALRWRVHWKWYALVFLGPAALMLAAVGCHMALGGRAPKFPSLVRWPLVLVNLLAILVIGGPLGEEFGWRGFALPRWQARYSAAVSGLIVGALWGVWHLPLFFVHGSAQYGLPFLAYAVQAIALSVVMAWLYNRTGGSLLLVLLLHATVNTLAQPLGLAPAATGSVRPFLFSVVLLGCCAIGVGLLGSAAPRKRLGQAADAINESITFSP
jgi:uncharacterized protein